MEDVIELNLIASVFKRTSFYGATGCAIQKALRTLGYGECGVGVYTVCINKQDYTIGREWEGYQSEAFERDAEVAKRHEYSPGIIVRTLTLTKQTTP